LQSWRSLGGSYWDPWDYLMEAATFIGRSLD